MQMLQQPDRIIILYSNDNEENRCSEFRSTMPRTSIHRHGHASANAYIAKSTAGSFNRSGCLMSHSASTRAVSFTLTSLGTQFLSGSNSPKLATVITIPVHTPRSNEALFVSDCLQPSNTWLPLTSAALAEAIIVNAAAKANLIASLLL
jgi:hypothetical protein